jgi:arginyl-tRNA synthetase
MDSLLPIAHVPGYELEPAEIQLIDLISRIPGEIQRSAKEYKPLYVASLAYELARAFNDFYMQCQVLKAEPEVREFRLRLVTASRQAIANLLRILGILSPEVM